VLHVCQPATQAGLHLYVNTTIITLVGVKWNSQVGEIRALCRESMQWISFIF